MIGTEIGPYRIDARLGEGGMGTVFRALDTRLGRPVAIKFLSDELADTAARRRFQREAQTASSLNHPHIVTVYDAGEWEGRQYLVTEFIDGGTLKDWAKSEQRSWRDIVELLVGVADALATAHVAGILHRDIKPDNILITSTGYAKLADFGLAKLVENSPPQETTRTISQGHTRPGMIVGTIAYMSPEQAAGRPVDARSDVFSFGVVLYELLAGRRPFAGATDLELLQTIIHGTAPPLEAGIPQPLRALVEKALRKDPADRYQSTRELVADLRALMRQSVELPPAPHRTRRITPWFAAAGLVALVAAGAFVYFSGVVSPPLRLEYTQLTNFADSATSPALSPDGRMLAFIRGPETFSGPGDIYVKLLPDGDPVQLTRDGSVKMSPAFTPDGARVAYTVSNPEQMGRGGTWTVPVLGGEPSRLLAAAEALSFIPNPQGPPRILFSQLEAGAENNHLLIVTAAQNRSDPRIVYAPPASRAMAHRSYLSPDAKHVLVVEMDGGWLPCRLVAFAGNAPVMVVGPAPSQCTSAAWSPDGKWMYFSANTGNGYHIWRQRFPDGKPEQITSGATEEEGIAFAPDGRSFVTSVGSKQSTLWVHDARGDRQITSQGYASLPQLSPDGKNLYYLLRSRSNRRFVSGELWTANLDTGHTERLLPDFLMEHYSISTDGKRIVFAAIDDTGHSPVWLATLDVSSAPRRLTTLDGVRTFFGAPGEVYFMSATAGESFVYRVREDGTGLQKAIPRPIAFFYDVSPDARSLAVYEGRTVMVYPVGGGSPTPVCSAVCGAAGGENRPITPPSITWSRDMKFVYLNVRRANEILAVPVPPGRNLPTLPPSGFRTIAEAEALPGARIIHEARAYVGADPSIYAFPRATSQRNIYRISLQ